MRRGACAREWWARGHAHEEPARLPIDGEGVSCFHYMLRLCAELVDRRHARGKPSGGLNGAGQLGWPGLAQHGRPDAAGWVALQGGDGVVRVEEGWV